MTPPLLATRVEGERGSPLVWFHALGASSRYFSGRLGDLPALHCCVLIDLLGFGQSPKPDTAAYTIMDHLASIDATLGSVGLDEQPITLIGHSLGAILAIEYAARFPARVARIVVMGLPYYSNAREARAFIGSHGDVLSRLTVANGRLAWLVCHAIHMAPRLSTRIAVTLGKQFPPEVAADTICHTWESYSRTLARCILDHDLTLALNGLPAVPILALHGRVDPTAPLSAVAALVPRFPNLHLQTLPGKHHLFLEEHDACLRAIQQFLMRSDARDS